MSGSTLGGAARSLSVPDDAQRDGLGDFIARVVRLDRATSVRLRTTDDRVVAWAPTPFEVLVTRTVVGRTHPGDLTVPATDLLAALAVVRGAQVDPGSPASGQWLIELPPDEVAGWELVQDIPATEVETVANLGIGQARELAGPHGVAPDELLDRAVLTAEGNGTTVPVPLRCLFALSGMGFIGGSTPDDRVRVSVTSSWLRLDTRHGSAVRRRYAPLRLLV